MGLGCGFKFIMSEGGYKLTFIKNEAIYYTLDSIPIIGQIILFVRAYFR
jgi:hypothetical protein